MKANCEDCPFKGSAKVQSEGNPETCKYAFIGEAPGYYEVRQQRPFVGPTGKIFNAFLERTGIDRSDCYIANALSCPVKNKKQASAAVRCCRARVLAELAQLNTGATIVLMGVIAREALYPLEKGGILASRGWREVKRHGTVRNIYIMAHPAYFMYNPSEAPMLQKDFMRVKRGRSEPPTVRYILLDTKEALEAFLSKLHSTPVAKRGLISYDLETDQVDYQRDRILCMSVSLETGTAYIIPDSMLYQDGIEFVTTDWSKKKMAAFLNDFRYHTGTYLKPNWDTVAALRVMFAIPGYVWTAHNSKFDQRFLYQLGVKNIHCDFDTIVAHYTLDERKGGHALKPLADDYYDSGDYEAELFNYIAKKSGRYSRIPRKVLYKYNAMDAGLTLRLAHDLTKELKEQGLYERPFQYPMMAALPMLLRAELEGMAIDWDEFERIDGEEIEPRLEDIAEQMREICGHPNLNPLSSKKVNDILYDEFNFPIIEVRTRAAGKRIKARSSQVAVMDGWAKLWEAGKLPVTERAWAFAQKLRLYRHFQKLRGSYIRKWVGLCGTDSRVHTSYLIRGTVTGRLSSKDPPMQTIPSKVKEPIAVMVANAHISRPGWKLLYADYSQAELMVAACLSGDEFMLNAFRKEGADYHSEVALAAFGPDFTHDDRQHCKRLTFGWLYGGNTREIALNALQFEGPVAERFAEEWDSMFKGVKIWRKAQGELMVKQGYVESVFGRRRRYLLLTKDNVGKAKRVAANAPIQSAVSDLNLISAIELHRKYKDTGYAHIVLLIHDSLVMEVRDDKVDEVKEELGRVMLEVAYRFFPQIPFKAEVKVNTRLGEMT